MSLPRFVTSDVFVLAFVVPTFLVLTLSVYHQRTQLIESVYQLIEASEDTFDKVCYQLTKTSENTADRVRYQLIETSKNTADRVRL